MHIPLIGLFIGVGIGIVISVPLGPVGLIIMKRTAEFGFRAGIVSGLAIVLIDSIATLLILLGLHHSLPYIRPLPSWLHLVGAILIFGYGLRMVYTDPTRALVDDLPWHQHFISAAAIALTNPSTYFSFGVIGLLLTRFIDKPLFTRVTVAVGFFIGALLWWSTLAYIAFSQRDRYRSVRNLHRIVGVIIMLLAVGSLVPVHYFRHVLISFLS